MARLALVMLLAGTAAFAAPETPRVALPLMKSAPAIDGAIGEAEWAGAARIVGVVGRSGLLADREAVFWVGNDGKRLLLAMKSETPPGDEILVRAVKDDARDILAAFHDDSIELWIDPHRGKTAGDRRYFQIITNARGALYDRSYDPSNPANAVDVGWRVQWEFANKVVDGWWHVEIAIPLESLGARNDLDHPWGLRIGRNWQRPGEQTRWESVITAFDDQPSMPVVSWEKDAPVVQMLSLRDGEKAAIRVRVANPGDAPLPVKVLLSDAWASNPPAERERALTIPAGASEEVLLNAPDGGPEGIHRTLIRVTSPDGTRPFFVREFRWKLRHPAEVWSIARQEKQAVDLQFRVYPYLNKVKAKVDISALAARERVTGGTLRVVRAGAEKPLAEQRIAFKDGVSETLFDTPPLPEGDYTFSLQLEGGEGVPKEPVTQAFERRVFPWEHNTLGISDKVIPPFTPLRVSGKKVSCVLRDHVAGESGLWDRVTSQGRDLLAGPMRWEAVSGGKLLPVMGKGWKVESARETEVVGVAAWEAGPVRAAVRAEMDYDGMTKLTLRLPAVLGVSLDRLTLAIPIRASEAGYLHTCGDQLRHNYAGKLPEGEGVVWDSSKGNKTDIVGTFYPYVWVGGGERGLCWFADGDRDWSLDDKTPTVELLRQGETLTLRVHFITRPTKLDRERSIVFGVQATPAKPMPADWRKWQCSRNLPGTRLFNIVGATHYYGQLSYDFYPPKHDLTIYRKLSEARDTGKPEMAYAEEWVRTFLPELKPGSERHTFFINHIRAGLHSAAGTPRARGARFVPYTNPRGIGFHMEEWPTFQDEWVNFAYYNRSKQGSLAYEITPTRSFQDAALWYYKEMSQAFDGIYWDNTFLAADWDTVVGGAWVDEQGRTHPGMGLWAMRELIKRTAVMFHQMGREGVFVSHMTNTNLVPVNAFANVNLDWEWKYGATDFQERFTPEMTVAQTIGRQTGNVPLILAGGLYDRKHPDYDRVMRTRLGVTLVHELRIWDWQPPSDLEVLKKLYAFGYGEPDCRVFNYWDAGHPVKVEGLDARTLAMARGQRALVIVTDYGSGGAGKAILDLKALGLPEGAAARDLETDAPIERLSPGVFTVEVKKHDFRVMAVE